MHTIDPSTAFERALKNGTLCDWKDAASHVGDYMYMYSSRAGDHFKHRDTRNYVVSPVD